MAQDFAKALAPEQREPTSEPTEAELTEAQLDQVAGGAGTYSKTLTFTLSTTNP
jgi:hypothetical protein